MTSEVDAKAKTEYTQLSKLMENLISKKLKVKEATYFKKRHTYVTGSDFENFIKENVEYICSEINKIMPDLNLDAKSEKIEQKIFTVFHDKHMFFKAAKEEDDRKKYPKKLLVWEEDPEDNDCGSCCDDDKGKSNHKKNDSAKNNFHLLDSAGYYIVYYQVSHSSLYFYLVLLIVGILAFCLLPVWPLELKIFIWWVSYILLIFMVSLIIIRLIIYSFFLIFGKEFWLFPDLFNDNKGVLESFSPLYSYETKPITYFSILCRIVLAGIVVYSSYSIYTEPTLIDDGYNHIKEIISDMFTYVEDKIIQHHNGTQISIIHNKDKLRDLLNDNDL